MQNRLTGRIKTCFQAFIDFFYAMFPIPAGHLQAALMGITSHGLSRKIAFGCGAQAFFKHGDEGAHRFIAQIHGHLLHTFSRGQLQQGMQKLHLLSPPREAQTRVLLDQAQ